MAGGTCEFHSEFARKYLTQGRIEGRAEGRREARADAVLDVLEVRELPISEEVRARVLACTSVLQLRLWVRKAVVVASAEHLFALSGWYPRIALEDLKQQQAKGEARGRAEVVLEVLEARGLSVSDEARARILECTDSAHLATWVRKAVTVASVDELL